MKPKISIITLGVKDLQKSKDFYLKLGLPLHQPADENICFFEMEGTWLALFPLDKLAEDAQIESESSPKKQFTLAHNVSSPEEVDQAIEEALKAGARLVKKPQKVFWGGYSGYFADPDDNLWEVAHNPFMDLT